MTTPDIDALLTELRLEAAAKARTPDRNGHIHLPDDPPPKPATFDHPLMHALDGLDREIAQIGQHGIRGQIEGLSQQLRRQIFMAVSMGG